MKIKEIIFSLVLVCWGSALGVELLTPNGGEKLLAGGVYTIAWRWERPFEQELWNAYLDYSIDGGETWQPVGDDWGWVPNTGFYTWNVPIVDSNDCLLRIELYRVCFLPVGFRCYDGDIDLDDDVDLNDFAHLGLAWGSTPNDGNWDPNADISDPNDNVIDEFDLLVLSDWWLAGTYPVEDITDDTFTIFQLY